MKAMRRFLAFFLVLVLFVAVGCSSRPAPSESLGQQPVISGGEKNQTGAEVAMLTTHALRESVEGQTIWSIVNRFAGENALTSAQYKTEEDSAEAALATLDLAVKGGARLVVVLGETMSLLLEQGSLRHPDVDFVYIDSGGGTPQQKNVTEIRVSYMDGGWLAGYAAVYEGARSLAYLQDETVRNKMYAAGFMLGADQAAVDLNLAGGAVTMRGLSLNPDLNSNWEKVAVESYNNGVDVVFATVQGAQKQMETAAGITGGKVISADFLSADEKEIWMSVTVDLKDTLYSFLGDWNAKGLQGDLLRIANVQNKSITLLFEEKQMTHITDKSYAEWIRNFKNVDFTKELETHREIVNGNQIDLLAALQLRLVTAPGSHLNGVAQSAPLELGTIATTEQKTDQGQNSPPASQDTPTGNDVTTGTGEAEEAEVPGEENQVEGVDLP